MMNISLLTVPVILDTTTQPSQLLTQWVRVYHYGHQVLPGISITTCALYTYAAFRKRAAGHAWRAFAVAGLTTLCMLPFTWTVMKPTINALFAAEMESKAGRVASWDAAVGLVTTWTMMHTTRVLFPLTGAILGLWATLSQL